MEGDSSQSEAKSLQFSLRDPTKIQVEVISRKMGSILMGIWHLAQGAQRIVPAIMTLQPSPITTLESWTNLAQLTIALKILDL